MLIYFRLIFTVSFWWLIPWKTSAQESAPILLRLEAVLRADPQLADSLGRTYAEFLISGREDPYDSSAAHAARLLGNACQQAGEAELAEYFHAFAGSTTWAMDRPSFLTSSLLRRASIRDVQRRYSEAAELYTEASILAHRTGDSLQLLQASAGIAAVNVKIGDLRKALNQLRVLLPKIIRSGDPGLLTDVKLAEAYALIGLQQPDSALVALHEALQRCSIARDSLRSAEILLLRARLHRNRGENDLSGTMLQQASGWMRPHSEQRVLLLVSLADLSMARNAPDRANEYLEQADSLARQRYPQRWVEDVFPALASLLARSGTPGQLISLIQRYRQTSLALAEITARNNIHTERMLIHWERLLSTDIADQSRLRERNRILGVMFALLISAFFAVVVIFRQHQRMREQLRTLFRKNMEEMQQAANASAVQSITEAALPSNLEQASTHARYQAILQLMEREKPWLEPSFSLHDLSTRLTTNHKYISQAINMYSETGFSGLMNRYRVSEARRLILEGKPDTSLNDIALQAGFTNRISFYRQFKETTGISPSEFVKMAR